MGKNGLVVKIVKKCGMCNNKYIDLGQPKSVAPGPGCSEPD